MTRSAVTTRSGRLFVQAIFCSTLLAALLALPSHATADNFAIDIYVTTIPAEGETFQQVYYEGGVLNVPDAALGEDGITQLDADLEGGDGLKEAIDTALAKANEKFSAADVRFELRNIYLISAKHKAIAPFFQGGDTQMFSLGMKDKKSELLAAFDKATSSSKGAFRVLLAPIEEHSEVGIAETPGTVSVIDAGPALMPSLNGFGLIHELAHNLGVHKHKGDPLNNAMAEGVPAPQGAQKVDPALDAEEIATIKRAVATGRYNEFRVGTTESAEDSNQDTKQGSNAPNKGSGTKKTATPKTEKKTSKTSSKPKPATSETAGSPGRSRNIGKILEFGVGVGLGTATSKKGKSRSRNHPQNYQNYP